MKREAALLIGPTGSGKSPLGDVLEAEGWDEQRPAIHFDFGENLRRAERGEYPIVNSEDRVFIRQVLQEGAVLEADTFYLAGQILQSFLERKAVKDSTIIILNGFPRHTKQAEYIAQFVDVKTLVSIEASAETVLKRLETNSGGDRAARMDDGLELVQKKLQIFRERTLPLINWYTTKAKIVSIVSEVDTSAAEMAAQLKAQMRKS